MSRRENLKARDKITQKMSRNGLMTVNEATGESQIISKRGAEIDLRGGKPTKQAFSQAVSRQDSGAAKRNKSLNIPTDAEQIAEANPQQLGDLPTEETRGSPVLAEDTGKMQAQHQAAPNGPMPYPSRQFESKYRTQHDTPLRQEEPARELDKLRHEGQAPTHAPMPCEPPKLQHETTARTEHEPVLQTSQTPQTPQGKAKRQAATPPSDRPKAGSGADTPPKQDAPGRQSYAKYEATPETPKSHKLQKAETRAEKSGAKLENAQNRLPSKHVLRSERVFDEHKGKAKRRIYFEKEAKTQGQHLKGALPLRPFKAAGNALVLNAHRKIYQAEHENVSVKAAHRAELFTESGIRAALRFHKTAPYRKVTRLEKQAEKAAVNLNYQKAIADNPKLSSNIFSRMAQKQKIKRDYAKAAREAKKTAQSVKRAGSFTARAARGVASAVSSHPVAAAVFVLVALLLFTLLSLLSVFSNAGIGGFGVVLASSYLAEDADIDSVVLSYTEWETDLQAQIANTESDYPDFDEYVYQIGDISHDPYELMAYLTAVYQYFPYAAVSSDLQAMFDEQYTLAFTETTETRYADPEDENGDGDDEPFEWRVLTVTLDSLPYSDVILSKMDAEQREHYEILMETKGNRQYVANPFTVNWLPYVTSNYGWRVHPITGAKDLHRGIDIAMPAGTEIHAAQDGEVTFARNSGDYGNIVIIENDKGLVTKYAHCDSLLVSAGQTVAVGDAIGTIGSTGASTGPHLHFETMKEGQYVNPLYFTDTIA